MADCPLVTHVEVAHGDNLCSDGRQGNEIAIHTTLARQCDPGKAGKPDRPDAATRMAQDADFSERAECSSAPEGEPAPRVDPIDELMRIVGENAAPPPRRAAQRRHRIQTVSGAPRGADKAYEWCSFFTPSPSAGARAGATGSHVVAAPSEQRRVFSI